MCPSDFKMVKHHALKACLLLILLPTMFGCTNIGPGSVVKDRVEYSSSVSDSWMRLTLLNIVKIRYLVPPVYMDVSSIVSGNSLQSTVTGGAVLSSNTTKTVNLFNLGASEQYIDRPTITYTPLTGSKFIKSILTPIPPADLFTIIESGWNAEAMLSIGVSAINGFHNSEPSIKGGNEGDANFFKIIRSIDQLQQIGAISLRVSERRSPDRQADEKHPDLATLLTFKTGNDSAETTKLIAELKTLLGLQQHRNEFYLVFGAHSKNDNELAVQTRSLVQILSAMAAEMEVPPEHVKEGRTARSSVSAAPIIKIHCSDSSPDDAFAAIPYRDHWFWIDDRDIPSKRAFNFIMILFALAETGELRMPLITIPAQS